MKRPDWALGSGILALIIFLWDGDALAWGPAVHTVTALTALGGLKGLLPAVGEALKSFPWGFIYGCLAADFFVGKGYRDPSRHPHNWKGGFAFLQGARDTRERSFAFGFLSHLAADVVAHNFYVPRFISEHKDNALAGHAYAEFVADSLVGPGYTSLARKSLARELPACDDLIKLIASSGERQMKPRKGLYRGGVRLSDYFFTTREIFLPCRRSSERIDASFVEYHVRLSCEAVKDLLSGANRLPSLTLEPLGTQRGRFKVYADAVRRGSRRLFKKSAPLETS